MKNMNIFGSTLLICSISTIITVIAIGNFSNYLVAIEAACIVVFIVSFIGLFQSIKRIREENDNCRKVNIFWFGLISIGILITLVFSFGIKNHTLIAQIGNILGILLIIIGSSSYTLTFLIRRSS